MNSSQNSHSNLASFFSIIAPSSTFRYLSTSRYLFLLQIKLANLYSYLGLCLASMVIVVSSMDLAERPRNQRPTDPPTTTQKPETTTEDTSNRILSLPNEEKCMKSKFSKIYIKLCPVQVIWTEHCIVLNPCFDFFS